MELILSYTIELLLMFAFAVVMNFLIHCILNDAKFIHWPLCILYTIVISLTLLLPLYSCVHIYDFFYTLIMSALLGLIGKICFKENWRNSIIVTAIIGLLFAISNLLALLLFTLIHDESPAVIPENQALRIQILGLILIVFFIITLAIWYLRTFRTKRHLSAKMNIIFIAYLVIMLIGLSLATSDFIWHQVHLGQIYVWSLLFAPNLIFVLWLIISMQKQAEVQQNMLHDSLQKNYMEKLVHQLTDNNEDIRRRNHDFKHQLNVLQALNADGKSAELTKYINNLITNGTDSTLVLTKNTTLDALLSSKKLEAKSENIDFEITLEVEPALSYLTMDICVLLANALDNAFEATKKCDDNHKKIDLKLVAKETKFVLRMRNTLKEIPKTNGESITTSKADVLHHGVGLKSMEKTCRDLNGKITYEYDESQFMILIVLPR
ncbi:MAG: GHKL domain-containing protein [Lachnospiraceae bacterium]|nr:GHKL domain-containing protein [Lachnospiraceae bacterium]